MRTLSEEEKGLNQKAIERKTKELNIFQLSKEVVEMELALFGKKFEIGLYNKKKELEQVSSNVGFLESQINDLVKQNELGVNEKNE